jgi:hypothetical protein
MFTPSLGYTVPAAWGNFEDMPGNFLLIPPGGSLGGIGDGSSDYIGVYSGVALAAADCEEVPAADVGVDARSMAEALANRPGLAVSKPQAIEVGGLAGQMVDVDLVAGWTGSCPFAPGIPVVPLVIGTGPAGLHHVQVAGASTRFYFLDADPTNVVIEVNDAPGPTGREDYESTIEAFVFGGP